MRNLFAAALLTVALLAGPAITPAQAQSATLRFQIIEADGFTTVDPAIADVQRVLTDLFRFRGYRLAAEVVIRASEGGFSQTVAVANGQYYQISGSMGFERGADASPTGELRVSGLELKLQSLPDSPTRVSDYLVMLRSTPPILSTSLTIPVGQTVVVGSARPSADGPTLILVVRPIAE